MLAPARGSGATTGLLSYKLLKVANTLATVVHPSADGWQRAYWTGICLDDAPSCRF